MTFNTILLLVVFGLLGLHIGFHFGELHGYKQRMREEHQQFKEKE